jgi:uncharacterized membrane protein
MDQYTPMRERERERIVREKWMGHMFPGAWAMALALATALGAILVGGLVFGIYILVTKTGANTVQYDSLFVGFWGALAGGLFAFIVCLIVYLVEKYGRYEQRREMEVIV